MRTKSEEGIAETVDVASPQYAPEITENAKELGYKTANLQFVERLIADQTFTTAVVPEFMGIRKSDIIAHLKAYAPDCAGLWESFAKAQEGGGDTLTPAAKEQLEKLRNLIEQAFTEHPFPTEGLDDSGLFMVRSTSNEDRVDVANPGGNKSLPSKAENISASIGEVVASYFSENSLNQRLKSGEDVTIDLPLLACLVQKMVGEGITTDAAAKPPVSGVIYSDHGHVRIQAAPGHGELIVNSKGNFDSYYVTPAMQVYAELRNKTVRMVPYHNESDHKMELVMTTNDTDLAAKPSMEVPVVRRIADFAQLIESTYKMPMDMEFVYDPNSDQLNIVQARPIPLGKKGRVIPSALSNDFITREHPTALKGSVITPDLKTAIVISGPNEILICNTITEAKTRYLAQVNSPVQAIIIEQEAPDTSHEAGLFTSLKLPVLQVPSLQSAKDLVAQVNRHNMLIVDPQHSSIYQLSHAHLKSDGVIVKGLVSSSLTPHVSMIERVAGPAQMIMPRSLSELIENANTDPLRVDQLFRFKAASLLEEETSVTADENVITDLDKISLLGSNKSALTRILRKVQSHYDVELISTELYNQLMHNAGELAVLIELAEAAPEADKKQIEQYYLNSFRKFEGSITSAQKKNVLSTSMAREVQAYRDFNPLLERLPPEIKNEVLQDFLNAIELQRYLIDPNDWEKWQNFCVESCQTLESAKQLKNLTRGLVHMYMQTEWINISFLEKYEADPAVALNALTSEYEASVVSGENIIEASRILDQMEMQISSWSDPDNFMKNYAAFKTNQEKINLLLAVTDDSSEMVKIMAAKQFYRQIDIFDLTIKALQISSLYEDQNIQADNFKILITDFWELVRNQRELENKNGEREQVYDALSSKIPCKKALQISPTFAVSRTLILRVNHLEFQRGMADCHSLADLHSLVHQNGLTIVNKRLTKSVKCIENKIPNALHEMRDLLCTKEFLPELEFTTHATVSPNFMVVFDLMSSNIDYPKVELIYNVPLREHSAIVKMSYDHSSKIINLKYSFMGRGLAYEKNRWVELNQYGGMLLTSLTDVEYNSELTPTTLDINIKIPPNSQTKTTVGTVMNAYISSTFDNNNTLKYLLSKKGPLLQSLNIIQELAKGSNHDTDQRVAKLIEDGLIQFCPKYDLSEAVVKYITNNANDPTKAKELNNALQYLFNKHDKENLIKTKELSPSAYNIFVSNVVKDLNPSSARMDLLVILEPDLVNSLQYCVECIKHNEIAKGLKSIESMKSENIIPLLKWLNYHLNSLNTPILALAIIRKASAADLNNVNNNKYPLLSRASLYGQPEIFNLALERMEQPDLTIRDVRGNTVLHLAAMSGNYEMFRLVLEKMQDRVMDKGGWGNTLFHLAASSGNTKIFRLALEKMPLGFMEKNNYGETVLHSAALSRNTEIFRLALKKMPREFMEKNNYGQTVLHSAAESGNAEIFRLALKQMPNSITKTDNKGRTVLHIAARNGGVQMFRLALEKMPQHSIMATDKDGATALHCAACSDNPEMFRVAFKKMPDKMMEKDRFGKTVLDIAVRKHIGFSTRKNIGDKIIYFAARLVNSKIFKLAFTKISNSLNNKNQKYAATKLLHHRLNDLEHKPIEIMKNIIMRYPLRTLQLTFKDIIADYLNRKDKHDITNFSKIIKTGDVEVVIQALDYGANPTLLKTPEVVERLQQMIVNDPDEELKQRVAERLQELQQAKRLNRESYHANRVTKSRSIEESKGIDRIR